MNFDSPQLLIYLWILPLVSLILWLSYKRRLKRIKLWAELRLAELSTHSLSQGRFICKSCLLLLSIALLILCLARPRWGFTWKDVPRGGIDIMVVLDLSHSMLATDIPPNRLERAKREIIDLLEMLQGDRLGIVAFAGVPFVQCPLTEDYRLASLFISQLSIDLIPIQGTALGDAITLAQESLIKGSASDSQGKAIILITDGEDQGNNALAAAAAAKKEGIKIYAVGIGQEEGAPIPLPAGGFKKDRNGNVIISRLDEKTLEQIALDTEGVYVRSTTGDLDLDQIYTKGIRASLSDGSYGETRKKIWYERYQWFLGLALILLLIEFFFRDTKKIQQRRNMSKNSQEESNYTSKHLKTT